jgi:hypothetical protein
MGISERGLSRSVRKQAWQAGTLNNAIAMSIYPTFDASLHQHKLHKAPRQSKSKPFRLSPSSPLSPSSNQASVATATPATLATRAQRYLCLSATPKDTTQSSVGAREPASRQARRGGATTDAEMIARVRASPRC